MLLLPLVVSGLATFGQMMVGSFGSAASWSLVSLVENFFRPPMLTHAVGLAAVLITPASAYRNWSAAGKSLLVAARCSVLSNGKHGAPQRPSGAAGNILHWPSRVLILGNEGLCVAVVSSVNASTLNGNVSTVNLM